MFLLDNKMSFWQVIIIQVVVVTAAVDLNSTAKSTCNIKSPRDDANTRTCAQQCISPVNSSCDMTCTPERQDNVTNCVQTCLTGTEHSKCKASCDTRKGNCDQRLDNGAGGCSAKRCTQTCVQLGFAGKCSLNCTGYRCFQLCNEENQCKLSCGSEVEICHQEIFPSSKPKQAVCNSNHCLQRCDSRTICECSGSNCRQECYNRGCNMTCHPGVIKCAQYCPYGGCALTCFAQKCIRNTADNIRSTNSLPTTVIIKTTPFTKTTDRQSTSAMITDKSTRTAKILYQPERMSTPTTTSTKTERSSESSIVRVTTGKGLNQTEFSNTPTSAKAERSSKVEGLHHTELSNMPISAKAETSSEDSVLQPNAGSQKDFNMFLLVVLITLSIVILILVIVIGCLLQHLKKLKSSANITEVALLEMKSKDEGFQLVPLMKETNNTKIDSL